MKIGKTTFILSSTAIQTTNLDLYDTISLVCGDGQGKNFCGTRTVSFYDNFNNNDMAS